MAISRLWRIRVGTRATFSPVEQFCVCEVTSCEVITLHHLPLCLCMFVPQWRPGGEAQPASVQAEVSRQFLEARVRPWHLSSRWSTSHKPSAFGSLGTQTSLNPLASKFHVGGWSPQSMWLFRGATLRGLWLQFDRSASELWTYDVGDRKLPAWCFFSFSFPFSFPWWTKPQCFLVVKHFLIKGRKQSKHT